MKKFFYTLALILSILMTSCTTADVATPVPTAKTVIDVEPTVASTPTPEPAEAPSNRDAAITAVSNQAQARATAEQEFVSAEKGMVILIGGSVQTFQESRASLNLRPEGTIIRVGPNSTFTMHALDDDGEPKTHINLDLGQIWILLNGGALEVETPSGVASVRGSLLGVSYDPELGRMAASCLEGTCALWNDLGKVDLTDGQKSFIEGNFGPSFVEFMDEFELQEWVNENPDFWKYFNLGEGEDFPDWLPEPDFFWISQNSEYFDWVFDEENPILDKFLEEHNLESYNPDDPFWDSPLGDGGILDGDGILNGDGILDGDGPLGDGGNLGDNLPDSGGNLGDNLPGGGGGGGGFDGPFGN